MKDTQQESPAHATRGMAFRLLRRLPRLAGEGLLLCLIAAALLLAAEFGLRAVGFGHSTRLFIKKEFEGRQYWMTNGNFFQQFFALPIDTMWHDAETYVPVLKPPNHCRIVILGGSAALGVPPDFAFSFARALEVMLRERFPETHFDVYMLAQPGVNSYVMYEAARACRRIQPDLFIVYMGNNEVNGPFGATVQEANPWQMSLPLIRFRIRLRELRLAQLAAGRGRVPWHAPLEDRHTYIGHDDPRLRRTETHYARNLEGILEAARDAGAAVLFCTVGCNLRDCAPMASFHRADLSPEDLETWEDHYQRGVFFQEEEQWQNAVAAYEAAARIDDTHAELRFRMGRCLLAMGDAARARAHFLAAWEYDAFRGRVQPRVNGAIRRIAETLREPAMRLVDIERALSENSPHGIAGREFFYDNVHLTFPGNYQIARELFGQVVQLLGPKLGVPDNASPEPLSLEACEERLGLTPGVLLKHIRGVQMGYRMWWQIPTPELDQEEAALDDLTRDTFLPGILAGYERALEFNPNDRIIRTRCAEVLLEMGDNERARAQARILVEQFPHRPATHRFLGTVLTREDRYQEALQSLDVALGLFPRESKTHYERGQLLERLGRKEEAKQAYIRAILLNPREFEPYDPLNAIAQEQGGPPARAALWRAIVKDAPDAARAHFHLGMALEAMDDIVGAIHAYREATRLEQFDPAMFAALGRAYVKVEDYMSAILPIQRALQINPEIQDLALMLVDAFIRVGNMKEAREYTQHWTEKGEEVPPEIRARLREAGIEAPEATP